MDVWLFVCLMKINEFPGGGSVTAGILSIVSHENTQSFTEREKKVLLKLNTQISVLKLTISAILKTEAQ